MVIGGGSFSSGVQSLISLSYSVKNSSNMQINLVGSDAKRRHESKQGEKLLGSAHARACMCVSGDKKDGVKMPKIHE